MDIIAMARELGKEIQKDSRYLRLEAAKRANDEDQDLQVAIEKFNLKRVELSTEINREDRDVNKLSQLDKELKELYQAVMENPNMIEFNESKNEVDDMMNFINEIMMGSVNGENPDLIEHQAGCGGNCAGCAGCH